LIAPTSKSVEHIIPERFGKTNHHIGARNPYAMVATITSAVKFEKMVLEKTIL